MTINLASYERERVIEVDRDHTDELLTRLVFKISRSLGAVRSTTQALLGGADEDRALRRDMLGGVDEELDELQLLLDNVVQLKAFEKGTFRLHRKRIYPAGWLIAHLERWQAAGRAAGLEWEIDIPEQLEPVFVDTEKLEQLLHNVLSSVVRNSPSGASIVITAESRDGALELRIKARGLLAEEYARVFNLFYTAVRLGKYPTDTGLGLHVARLLAAAHGGSLGVAGATDVAASPSLENGPETGDSGLAGRSRDALGDWHTFVLTLPPIDAVTAAANQNPAKYAS